MLRFRIVAAGTLACVAAHHYGLNCDAKERVYTSKEVAEHRTREAGVWVTYKGNVYDVTTFLEQHPGGSARLMMAAGGPVESYWVLYKQHLNNPRVTEILEKHRIGKLDPDEQRKVEAAANENDPFRNDPKRHPALLVNTPAPFNAEPPASLMTDQFITPAELFYVRNHHPVPVVDADKHRVDVTGLGVERPLSLSINDIKTKFPQHTIVATMQCAGNRRTQLRSVREVMGNFWGFGAISNAEWTGARLSDILTDAQLDSSKGVKHIQFEGLDEPFATSIPVEKAVNPLGDVLVAHTMNGEPLLRDHGFPVRILVPGTAGARSVKWVKRIVASAEEANTPWQRGVAYKALSPAETKLDNLTQDELDKHMSIQELPVQSAVCVPDNGARVAASDEVVFIRGYAWSGGGRGISRVDVTPDNGATWVVATLLDGSEQQYGRAWAWTLWEAQVPIPQGAKQIEIAAKAVDTSLNVQPERVESVWNLRGTGNNAWHRMTVNVDTEK